MKILTMTNRAAFVAIAAVENLIWMMKSSTTKQLAGTSARIVVTLILATDHARPRLHPRRRPLPCGQRVHHGHG